MTRRRNRGFTLIEVLLVIGILLVLGTVAVVGYSKIKAGTDHDLAAAMIKQTCDAVDIYYIKMGAYPTTEEGLKALCEPPSDETLVEKWNSGGPFLKDGKIPVDPWGQELQYKLMDTGGTSGAGAATPTGPAYIVSSNGPDKQQDTDDDIKSYTDKTSPGSGTK